MKKTTSILIKKNVINFICVLLFPALIACSPINKTSVPSACDKFSLPCLNGQARVKIETNRGNILLEINGDSAPITAGNFLDIANNEGYNNTIFHRVIKYPVPFVAQGGDPLTRNINTNKNDYGKGSYIDPLSGQARFIPLELKLKSNNKPKYNILIKNPNEIEELELRHERGSISMARSQPLNSASAQFYISLKKLPELDGRYSVFGKVIKGMDIVDLIEEGDLIQSISIVNK